LPTTKRWRKAIRASAKGRLIAWDPVRRKPAWDGRVPDRWNGGTLATRAVSSSRETASASSWRTTPRTVSRWDFFAQTGILAAPVTYEIDGEQYVTVLAGSGRRVASVRRRSGDAGAARPVSTGTC